MNRKNWTAAVLAGLAGMAGIAGTAQAVNLNPDGVGQVLIYPYYTSNGGNQTILSVVNTTSEAKAVKVRFLEGFNSREVLDFNLYLSEFDVWVAAITDDGGTPTLIIPDSSCTVPYLYGWGIDQGLDYGMQEFLDFAYTGSCSSLEEDEFSCEDGGPTDIARASEGHIEMIEMGVLTDDSKVDPEERFVGDPGRPGSATAATHVVKEDGSSQPLDCYQLVRNWTAYAAGFSKDDDLDGIWLEESLIDGQASTDTVRNSGGLFGSAAIINAANGTMFSYDPKAVQGFDKTSDGIHYVPGTTHPSLDDGNQFTANIFFGTPSNAAVSLSYGLSVDAVSAVFMHDNIMNEFTIESNLNAATEWIFTFPTKSFYVDLADLELWEPNQADAGCLGWDPGEPFPARTGPDASDGDAIKNIGWEQCTYLVTVFGDFRPPFTEAFDGEACEFASLMDWDREENASTPGTPGEGPPIVSPAPPGPPSTPGAAPFELCYEVNVMRFGDGDIFGTTSALLLEVNGTATSGWANVNFEEAADDHPVLADGDEVHQDRNGLVGLPVIGFAAFEFENGFLGTPGDSVLANYSGLFDHKASVKRISADCGYHDNCFAD